MKNQQPDPQARLRVLLCGYGALALGLLEGLLANADICEVVGVFRWAARPNVGGGWEPVEARFAARVKAAGLPEVSCAGINSYAFTTILSDLQPDVVLIGSWGEIIKSHVIELPGLQLINCHPSLLPAHRGANPYTSVILQQETHTGVTFHRIDASIDTGEILLQAEVPVEPLDTGGTVRDRCAAKAEALTPRLLQMLRRARQTETRLAGIAQVHGNASSYPQLKPADGFIRWPDSTDNILRRARALTPWLPTFSMFNKHVVLCEKMESLTIAACPAVIRKTLSGQALLAGTMLGRVGLLYFVSTGDTVFKAANVSSAGDELPTGSVLVLRQFRVAFWNLYLPFWLSSLLGRLWFKSGRSFNT